MRKLVIIPTYLERENVSAMIDKVFSLPEAFDLLIIDDLGTEMNSTFVQSALYQLINGRLLGMKSTIISTNLTPEDIGRRYSQQVYSRIEGEYTILPFIGTDIRQLKRQRGEK